MPDSEVTRLDPGPLAREVRLPVDAIDATRFGVGELLDIADALNTDLAGLAATMKTPGIQQARLLVAIAWILVRRLEPGVTFADAQRWRIEVDARDPANPTPGGEPETAPPEIAVSLGI
jgi:hypothetical protein